MFMAPTVPWDNRMFVNLGGGNLTKLKAVFYTFISTNAQNILSVKKYKWKWTKIICISVSASSMCLLFKLTNFTVFCTRIMNLMPAYLIISPKPSPNTYEYNSDKELLSIFKSVFRFIKRLKQNMHKTTTLRLLLASMLFFYCFLFLVCSWSKQMRKKNKNKKLCLKSSVIHQVLSVNYRGVNFLTFVRCPIFRPMSMW